MNRQLKIALWNANGVATRRDELQLFATDNDLDVILLTETRLQGGNVFNIPGFQTYRTDRPQRGARNPGGGTAVLVHRRITHRELQIVCNLETTGIALKAGDFEICIFSVYAAPGAAFRPAMLDVLLDEGHTTLIGGDFNAKHMTWGCRRPNPRGNRLRAHLDQRGDVSVAAPDEPTFYSPTLRVQPDILDIFLTKDLQFPSTIAVADDLSSDHVPVILTVGAAPTLGYPPRTQKLRTDWTKYSELLDFRLEPLQPAADVAELDSQVTGLTLAITDALEAASRPAKPAPEKPPLPVHIREAVNKRRRLRRIWQRTRCPLTKRAFNGQCFIVKNLLSAHKAASWETYLAGLELADGSAWRTAKVLRNEKPTSQPIHGQRGMAYSASAKAEAFADTMEEQFRPHADIYDDDHIEDVEDFLTDYFSRDPEDAIQPFSVEEVETAVRRSKPRKAPGLDGVRSRALISGPPSLISCLVTVFNAVLSLRHFPTSWKVAKIVLFPKPGKSRLFPQNYRPISLLPTISKIFERLLLSRLSPLLEGFIRPEQFGFRRGHSTTQQLVRTVNNLIDNANLNLCSVAVLLDVSKAFDKVWHDGLLYKMTETPLPTSAIHLLRSYLSGRSFRASVETELSTERPIESGVPQGSVLGPVLYLIFTNDIPTIPRIVLSLYADDALFVCRSASPQFARNTMQRQMDALSPWLEKWRVAVNADKSKAICFRKRRRMPRVLPDPPTLDDEEIEWTSQAKYLGVILDSKLNFAPHAKQKLAEAKKIQGAMSPLLGKRSSLPARTKVTMFMLVVRSVIMYASSAWWAICAKTHRKNLEIVQNKALRAITKQPWFVRNETIRRGLQVPTLQQFAWLSANKFFSAASESGLPHIEQISVRHEIAEDYRPRPAAILDQPP